MGASTFGVDLSLRLEFMFNQGSLGAPLGFPTYYVLTDKVRELLNLFGYDISYPKEGSILRELSYQIDVLEEKRSSGTQTIRSIWVEESTAWHNQHLTEGKCSFGYAYG